MITMKKHLIKMITLLAFSSILLSSCSMEYRERRRQHNEGRHDHDHDHDHDHSNDRHYYNNR